MATCISFLFSIPFVAFTVRKDLNQRTQARKHAIAYETASSREHACRCRCRCMYLLELPREEAPSFLRTCAFRHLVKSSRFTCFWRSVSHHGKKRKESEIGGCMNVKKRSKDGGQMDRRTAVVRRRPTKQSGHLESVSSTRNGRLVLGYLP